MHVHNRERVSGITVTFQHYYYFVLLRLCKSAFGTFCTFVLHIYSTKTHHQTVTYNKYITQSTPTALLYAMYAICLRLWLST